MGQEGEEEFPMTKTSGETCVHYPRPETHPVNSTHGERHHTGVGISVRSSYACTSVEHFPDLWKAIFLLHSFTQISLSKPILHLPPMGCHWSGSTVHFLFASFETELCWLTGMWVLGSKNGFQGLGRGLCPSSQSLTLSLPIH